MYNSIVLMAHNAGRNKIPAWFFLAVDTGLD
jgi:hypothetical protein